MFKKIFVLGLFVFCTSVVFAQNRSISSDGFWLETAVDSLAGKEPAKAIPPSSFRVFSLNKNAMLGFLDRAPMEFTGEAQANPYVVTLPMPDGTFQRFRIEESPVMEKGLAEKFPEIRTFRGYGIDDPTASVRFDWTSAGFHSMILSPSGTVFVDPYAKGDTENYISYFKNDLQRIGNFVCDFKETNKNIFKVDDSFSSHPFGESEDVTSGTTLRTYRLALAANFEYCAVFGGTVAGAMTAMTTTMNRVNGVYERDLAIHMNMVANNNLIVYAASSTNCGGGGCTSGTDPYSNTNPSAMLSQNQSNLTTVIGSANYDIGHVFSTGGGGVAVLNGPCTAATKAQGVTGSPSPSGDGYDIDYVAHEMGHQFGGNHTFNGGSGNCSGGNRSAANAYEPGSGITIMAYAGICGNQDLAPHSIDTMHVRSLEEIVAYSQSGNGNTCDVETSTGNTVPSVSLPLGSSFNIPINTPFALTAAATDANGDSITYDWQEYDLGAQTTAVPNTDATGAKPIFRPYLPSTSGVRYFPSLTYILNNANVPPSTSGSCPSTACLTGELLPTITRTMTFQVVARDNRANGGGINTATATVNVTNTSGPFAVTAPNTAVSWNGNTNQTVTWNVASTTGAPVSAANVRISLSTDGGNTFPTVLLASTPNDGTQSVLIPNSPTTQARIKVEGVGNIFFDVSNTNFTITAPTAANVSVVGRVVTQSGYGIGNVRVFLTSGTGLSVSAVTNAFGYFVFENVGVGFYTLTANSKRYQFESSALEINDNVQDLTIVALPSFRSYSK